MVHGSSSPTLQQLLERFGSQLINVTVASERSLSRAVTGVQLHDPIGDDGPREANLVLAPAVDPSSSSAADLVDRAAASKATGVLLRASDATHPRILGHTGSVAVLQAGWGLDWAHLITVLRMGLAYPHARESGDVPLGDLFSFANDLARRIGGAVTIEDPGSRVLAYSNLQADLDEPRKETILGRAVPAAYTRVLQERGVFRRLHASDEVVVMDALPEMGLRRRLAVRVQAAGEMLASIWVAEAGSPLPHDANEVLGRAAKTAVLHIMQHRVELHQGARLQDELMRELLIGGDTPPDVAAVRLGLEPDSSYAVVAFEACDDSASVSRLLRLVDLYCSAFHRPTPVVHQGPRVYAIVAASEERGEAPVRKFATDVVERASDALRTRVVAGAGAIHQTAGGASASRLDADRVLRVLLRTPDMPPVAGYDDVYAHATLLEVMDVLRERPQTRRNPISALSSDERGIVLRETLRAYLAHFGNVGAAASTMHCHPNTFRYRLRGATAATGIDLDDPVQRLVATLLLELER